MRICPRCRATVQGEERFCRRDNAPLVEPLDLERLGTTVGNYRLLEIMGRGGMGTVYRGEHVYIGRPFAVKILHERFARYEQAIKRFLREARAASSINHPNIVDVTDFGPMPEGRGVYFVMEYIEGTSLEDVLEKEGALQLHRAIGIVDQIASALAAAHEKGIIHRDLKPENIMLTRRPGRRDLVRVEHDEHGNQRFVIEPEGEFEFVKVLDFGIAKVLEPGVGDSDLADNTTAGTIFGTPEYMSPEAARGLAVDHRADIYSLGVMFYDMLTGRVPFEAPAPVDVLAKHVNEAPIPPRKKAPHLEITEAAERLILRALAKDPAARPQTMDEFRVELKRCYGRIAFRRDAAHIPGAKESGVLPRTKRLTEELDEWLAVHRDQLAAARREVAAQAGLPLEGEPVRSESDAPLLLTRRKT